MANTRKAAGDPNAGLVEAFIEDGKVVLQLLPPGRAPVAVGMLPAMARELGQSLIDGAEQAEQETPCRARAF